MASGTGGQAWALQSWFLLAAGRARAGRVSLHTCLDQVGLSQRDMRLHIVPTLT